MTSILPFAQPHFKVRAGPSGIHLFNRMTGLNILLDEIRVPPALWARAPRQVSIALTNACDLACSYCFAPKDPAVLDFQQVTDWIDELDANGCFGIGLGGGEPTLYPRLAELCQYATQHTMPFVICFAMQRVHSVFLFPSRYSPFMA